MQAHRLIHASKDAREVVRDGVCVDPPSFSSRLNADTTVYVQKDLKSGTGHLRRKVWSDDPEGGLYLTCCYRIARPARLIPQFLQGRHNGEKRLVLLPDDSETLRRPLADPFAERCKRPSCRPQPFFTTA